MNQLSQCMIVKNEEVNIRRALSWAGRISGEQIVVDTGSTDRTVEIALDMGAKVFHYEWEDDFASAKNYAINQASGQWIAFLDADEYIDPDEAEKIPRILDSLSPGKTDGIMMSMMQIDSQGQFFSGGTQVRIFPNRKDLRYKRRIHEQLAREDGKSLKLADGTKELVVFHTGYAKKEKIGDLKSQRNFRMICKELEAHPDDYEMLGYLGDVYYSAEELDKAEEIYRKAVKLIPEQIEEGDQRSAATFLNLIQIADQKNWPEEEVTTLYKAAVGRRELQKDADFGYLMGRWYLARERRKEALPFLMDAIEKMEQFGNFGRAMYASAGLQEICEQMAACMMETGNLNGAVSQSAAVLKEDPWSMLALCILLESFKRGGVNPAQADEFLNGLYDRNEQKAKIFLLRSAEKADWEELEKVFRTYFSSEELNYLDSAQTK